MFVSLPVLSAASSSLLEKSISSWHHLLNRRRETRVFPVSREEIMSVPNEPIVPPPAPPIGNPEPERDPGEAPPPDGPEPDDGDDPMTQAHAQEAQRSPTWGRRCRRVQVQAVD